MKNSEYIKNRDKLIPIAEKYANDEVGGTCVEGNREEWAAKWSNTFHTKMNKLAKEQGIT